MKNLTSSEELTSLRKKLVLAAILNCPGLVLIGLAIYGKDSEGHAFHPLLNNSSFTTSMLIFGGLIAASGAGQVYSISKRVMACQLALKTGQSK